MMHELQPGDPRLIGPYRLRGRLGADGMGQVFSSLVFPRAADPWR